MPVIAHLLNRTNPCGRAARPAHSQSKRKRALEDFLLDQEHEEKRK